MQPLLLVLNAVAAATFALVVVSVLAWAGRRLLDIEVGVVRSLVAAFFSLSLAGLIAAAVFTTFVRPSEIGEHCPPTGMFGFVPLIVGCALLITVFFLGVAETFVPSGSWPGLLEMLRSTRRRLGRTGRYTQIVGIAFRHGLGSYLRGGRGARAEETSGTPLARSLRLALDEAGVTFVKLGQMLSTRRDLLPDDFVAELRLLQDRVAPVPAAAVERILTEELGAPPAEVFAEFDPVPVAAASVAQVHRARLRSGERVAVKVQRPDVAQLVRKDLDIVRRLADVLHTRARWGRRIGIRELADGFAAALTEELDFRIEARNLASVGTATRQHPSGPGPAVRVPAVHTELSTGRVLVQEWFDGTRISDVGAAAADGRDRPVDGLALSRALLAALLRQVMLDGVFHADPHPGNIVLLPDGDLGLLDFGSVGRVDATVRTALQDMLVAIEYGDASGLRDALLQVVERPEEIDEHRLERALGQFMARHFHTGSQPDVAMFTDLFRLVSTYGLAVPPELAAVFRALATVEGTLTDLSPSFDIVAEARAFAADKFGDRLTPSSLRDLATQELVTLLPVLRRLPRRIDRLGSALEHGRLGLNVRLFADERERAVVTDLVSQALLAFVGATAGIIAVLLLGTSGGPRAIGSVSLYEMFGYNLLMLSALLLVRALVRAMRPTRRAVRRSP